MSKDKKCCPEKVELLIQSEVMGFEETDREWLEACSEEQIDKLVAMEESAADVKTLQEENDDLKTQVAAQKESITALEKKVNKKMDLPTPTISKEQAMKVLKDHLSDPDAFLGLLPEATRRQMEHGLRLHQAYRNDLIVKIKENAQEEVYSDQELMAMGDGDLEKLSKLVRPVVDYSLMGHGKRFSSYESPVEPLLPPGVVAQ